MDIKKRKLAIQNAVIKQASVMKINARIIRILLVSISLMTMVLTLFIYHLLTSRDFPPSYVVNYETFEMSKVVRLDNPNLSNEAILRWSSQVVSVIFSFNFSEIKSGLYPERVKDYFSERGYADFTEVLTSREIISDAVDKKLLYSAVSCDKVNIVDMIEFQEEGNNKTLWLIQVPLILKLESTSSKRFRRYLVTAMIESGTKIKVDKSIALVGIQAEQMSPLDNLCKLA